MKHLEFSSNSKTTAAGSKKSNAQCKARWENNDDEKSVVNTIDLKVTLDLWKTVS